jgi:hypothetical protein
LAFLSVTLLVFGEDLAVLTAVTAAFFVAGVFFTATFFAGVFFKGVFFSVLLAIFTGTKIYAK